ncbi:hypothetical protein ESCO_004550 [Escovopsis weberi]|uniref:LEA domain protein n=1 Tax=Escovopsis weberi TaxID=150374 RepID=A0A0M9VVQ5_ESCWE|nr:hypothetical protein ESCO_004550 [Escovopsis weberi]
MKSSPLVKGHEDPTHTSYEFSLPYTRRGDTQLEPRSPTPDPISSPITMESHGSDPGSVDDEELLALRARGLAGKYIDEFGNVLDWDGTVLGSVQGDLPSMVGRPVSESGYVVDSTGEMVGYVSENFTDSQQPQTHSPHPPLPPREIDRSLKVDEHGNILDANGEVVGKMKDHSRAGGTGGFGSGHDKGKAKKGETGAGPSAATPSPSEVYLDVKSTHDGIQLVIKIPTVFNPHGNSQN